MTTISLGYHSQPPTVRVLDLDNGQSFAVVDIGEDRIVTPGRDLDNVAYLRAWAEVLTQAAESIEQSVALRSRAPEPDDYEAGRRP